MDSKIALLISRVAHPLAIMPLFVIYTSHKIHDPLTAAWTAAGILGITVFPLVGWIRVKQKRGHYSNFDVSVRSERFSLYGFIVLLSVLLMVFLLVTKQPTTMVMGCLLMIQVLLVSFALNFWLKSSLHLAVCGYIAMGLWPMNTLFSVALLATMPLLATARVTLKRHTWQEVLIGASIGILSGIQFLYLTDQL